MNDELSPYEVSDSAMSAPSRASELPALPSSVPKVFGIIHIIYGAFGLISAVFSVGAFAALKALVPKGEIKEFDAMIDAYEGIVSFAYADMILKVVFGIVLITAGIGLLRRKRWAVGTSIFWAVSRMVAAVVMIVIMAEPTRVFQEKVYAANSQGGEQLQEFQQMATGVGNIVGVVMVCIYPILCLVFLARGNVKQSLR